eukprot:COSAG01_NODE_4647_length_4852_cov_3.841153_2_plen_51_part_00
MRCGGGVVSRAAAMGLAIDYIWRRSGVIIIVIGPAHAPAAAAGRGGVRNR